jgi:hypothetical protein
MNADRAKSMNKTVNERELSWDEFIDLDFTYGEPKAKERTQSEELWRTQTAMYRGKWKFVLKGEDTPKSGETLQMDIDFLTHTITSSFVVPSL